MHPVWNEILIVFILIVINGILAMSEAAMLSVRKARLQQRINEGNKRAHLALKLAENPNRFLSTIQIGITVIDVLIGAISGATVADLFSKVFAGIPVLAPFSGWPYKTLTAWFCSSPGRCRSFQNSLCRSSGCWENPPT
jgi:putative hemolysin